MPADAALLVKNIVDLPPFPAVAMRVMAMVNDQDTSAAQLSHVLTTDQALTAKLLQISNSAAYQRHVATVREAVIVLGFQQVRQLAFVTSVITSFNRARRSDDGFESDLFWAHNLAVAVAAEAVAKRLETVKPDEAFAAGVLHDIGRLALRIALPAEFATAIGLCARKEMSLREAELHTTGYNHEDVGTALGNLWSFPPRIVEAIGGHHRTDLSLRGDSLNGIVSWCDRLASHYHDGPGTPPEPGVAAPELCELDDLCGGWSQVQAKALAMMNTVASGDAQVSKVPKSA